MSRHASLSEFLRARREQLRPSDVGLPELGHRRVRGLRREEVAMLASVSPDYYVRLEQGRHLPSEQVTDALARALRLDDLETAHLYALARPSPDARSRRRDPQETRRALQTLLDHWSTTPAWVSNSHAEVLAANALATALNPACVPGGNMLRALFVDEARMREIYLDYDQVAADSVASLRARTSPHLDDPQFSSFLGDLRDESGLFAELWARHEVRFHGDGIKRLQHEIVGQLEFRSESMTLNDSDGQILTVYYAEPGSATADSLARLSSIVAS